MVHPDKPVSPIVSQSRVTEAEDRVTRRRKLVDRLEAAHHPADDAIARLLVMEQSLLVMRQFLSAVEQDLERSLGLAEKPLRRKVKRHRTKSNTDEIAQQVVDVLRRGGIDARVVDCDASPLLLTGRVRPNI